MLFSFHKDPLFEAAKKMLQRYASEKILIHSDLISSLRVKPKPFSAEALSQEHLQAMKEMVEGRDIIMPSFNYDFCQNGEYNVDQSPSQVGHLTEYFRMNGAEWRNEMPVFNFCGTGERPKENMSSGDVLDCFGKDSLFHFLREQNGLLMHYGSPFNMSMTIIHYCERISQVIPYRYDKIFPGHIHNGVNKYDVKLNYLVRPMNGEVKYDWSKLQQSLTEAGILDTVREGKRFVSVLGADELCSWLIPRIKAQPLVLLTEDSRKWVQHKLDALGRSFQLEDFEGNEISARR